VATDLQVLRRLIDEPDETTYSDVDLTTRINTAGNDLDVAALAVWEEKMAAASGFVNMSEGGSSRSLAQAFDHAQAMVTYFKTKVGRQPGGTVMRKITRV
jgi:hypothetical protein